MEGDTLTIFNKYAKAYQDKFMNLDLYDDTYDSFCKLLEKKNARVFEIGCGPGNITRYLLSKRPDLRIMGIDFAPCMIELAKENNPSADFKVMDCKQIGSVKEKHDGVICGFCAPYLSKGETLKLISDSAGMLNDGGIFYLSVIEGDYDKSGYETSSNGQDKCFVYFHEEDYLKNGLEKNNFELKDLIRKNYIKGDGTVSTHLILIGKKK
jgi:predicted TPR repeat methyltransferase